MTRCEVQYQALNTEVDIQVRCRRCHRSILVDGYCRHCSGIGDGGGEAATVGDAKVVGG